jgi:hypothetical protein
MGSSGVPVVRQLFALPSHHTFLHAPHPVLTRLQRTETAGVQWPHIEDVDTLHLSENFETLKTGRLLGIRGNGTGLGTGWEKVGLGLDLCDRDLLANDVGRDSCSRLRFGNTEILAVGAGRTVELLEPFKNAGRIGLVTGLLVRGGLLVHVACERVNGASYDGSWSDLRRTKEVVKVRWARTRGATRLAAATAERCRNMARAIEVEWRLGGGWWAWWCVDVLLR